MFRSAKLLRSEDRRTVNAIVSCQKIQDCVKIRPDGLQQIIDLALRHGVILDIFPIGISDRRISYLVRSGYRCIACIRIYLIDKCGEIGYEGIKEIKDPLLPVTATFYSFCVSHFYPPLIRSGLSLHESNMA
jgi:hypothetical protein